MTSLRLYLYGGVLLVLVVGGVWLRYHWEHLGAAKVVASVEKQSAKVTSQVQKQDDKAQADAARVTTQGSQSSAANSSQTKVVVRTITKLVHDKPSPATCVVSPDAQKALQKAVDDANAAGSVI